MTKTVADRTGKPTVNDIARVAGVSLATVDRVLNARPGVRRVTIDRVNSAIRELGYVRDTAAANLARRRIYNLLFILPETNNEFIAALESEIAAQSERLSIERTRLSTMKAPAFDPQELVRIIDTVDPAEFDGIAVFGPETPSVRDAARKVKEKGVAVVSLVSDLPRTSRDHFVGIDNVQAGKTAAQLIGRFAARDPGQILVITGSRLARDHLERRHGFDEVMTEEFPAFDVLPSLEGRDDPELLLELLPAVFEKNRRVRAIYSSAAGNAGLIRFLKSEGLDQDIVVVGHELTPLSRDALESGVFDAIISQDTGHLVRSAVRLLRATADDAPFNPTQECIRIDIYLKENMPPP